MLLLRAHGAWSCEELGAGGGVELPGRAAGVELARTRPHECGLRGGPVRGGEATRLRGCRGEARPCSRGRRALGGTSGCARAAPALHPRC